MKDTHPSTNGLPMGWQTIEQRLKQNSGAWSRTSLFFYAENDTLLHFKRQPTQEDYELYADRHGNGQKNRQHWTADRH